MAIFYIPIDKSIFVVSSNSHMLEYAKYLDSLYARPLTYVKFVFLRRIRITWNSTAIASYLFSYPSYLQSCDIRRCRYEYLVRPFFIEKLSVCTIWKGTNRFSPSFDQRVFEACRWRFEFPHLYRIILYRLDNETRKKVFTTLVNYLHSKYNF